jgi:hypothetical protein
MTLTAEEQRIVELILANQSIADALLSMRRTNPDGTERALYSEERRAIVEKAEAYIAAQRGQ